MKSKSDRQDGDGLLPAVNARVRQSGVYGGTRDGTVIKSNTDTFTVKWDVRTIACTYNRREMQGDDIQCPIIVIPPPRDAAEGAGETYGEALAKINNRFGFMSHRSHRVAASPFKSDPALKIIPTAARQDIRDLADAILSLHVQSGAGERGSDAAEADRYFDLAGEFGNRIQRAVMLIEDYDRHGSVDHSIAFELKKILAPQSSRES